MNYVLNLRRLVASRKVLPTEPSKSPLLKRILDGEMPPDGSDPTPSPDEITTLKRWIEAGAPVPADDSRRDFLTTAMVVESVLRDLETANERDRRFFRYFTLTHLYNAGLSDGELDTVRLAVSKLLNSLSWEPDLWHLHAVDDAKTVFRLDLRALGWGRATWDRIIDACEYSVRPADERFATCQSLSDCQSPLVRADWFVAAASQPPLYHEILEMPATLGELERQLRIDFRRNVDQDRAARAGFTRSGVSISPRIIERHRTSDGACWVSHDFAGSTGERNFFQHPLSFRPDGGEVIFNLPNGMQAYLLVDGSGQRIDRAPTSIVKDPETLDGAVTNGLSCMRCHAAGIIPKRDEVRETVRASPDAYAGQLASVEALYPPDSEFQKLIQQDTERFQSALKTLGITRFSSKGEPVSNTARRFHDALDVRLAAAELGVTDEALLTELNQNPRLQRALGILRVPGGMVSREAFTDTFPAAVAELGLGHTISGDSMRGTLPRRAFVPRSEPPPRRVELKLPEPWDAIRTGAGGRLLIFHLPSSHKLAIVDLVERRVVHNIDVPDGGVHYAAGLDKLMIVNRSQRLLERWSLETFEREEVAPLREERPVLQALMGSSSQGPLLLWSDGSTVFWDIERMQPLELAGPDGRNRWEFQLRIAADGQSFTTWHNGIGPSSFTLFRFSNDGVRKLPHGGFSHNGRWAQPGAEGRLLFMYVTGPELFTGDWKPVSREWPRYTVLLPTEDPRFFLAIHGGSEKNRVSICTAADQRIVYTYDGIENMTTSSMPGRWGNHGGEARVRFLLEEQILATLPDQEQIVIRHLDLLQALDDSGDSYLFLTSHPHERTEPGAAYEYRPQVVSKAGGVRFKLASAPDGMTVAGNGQVRWNVPRQAAGSTARVVLLISDAGGKELFHSFDIEVAE